MRRVLVAVALVVAVGSTADAATSRRACRAGCRSAISACVRTGGRRALCRREMIQRCRRDGPSVCAGLETATTTTTIPFFGPPTTTLDGPVARVTVGDVRTGFEIDWYVPQDGAEYVFVDVTIENDATYGLSPLGFLLETGGLGFAQSYLAPPGAAFPGCSSTVTILPGGSLACTLVFEIPEGTTSGRLAFGAPYAYPGGVAAVVSDDFAIPVAVRPTATLDVLSVTLGSPPAYCVRAGYESLVVGFAYTSHDGASGLTLDPYQFSLEAGGAVYGQDYCSYQPSDACSGAIGVPIDGSASCSMAFQVPATTTAATLRAQNTRYPAATSFSLD